jgi:hypothetical protein
MEAPHHASPNTTPGLETCPACKRDFVQPLDWEPEGPDRWWMLLRCAECGVSREVVISNEEADRFEIELHRRADLIAKAAARLEQERMAAEVDAFVEALRRGLIEADDFAR